MDANKFRIRMHILEVQKHTDPTDSDPEHWLEVRIFSKEMRSKLFLM